MVDKLPKETVLGCYVAAENAIYIAKEQSQEAVLHTLLHELKHAYDEQTKGTSEEDKCDSFASLVIRLFSPNLDSILRVKSK